MASIKLKGDTSGEVTISAPSVAGTTTLELPATSSTLATQNSLGVRNLIINGDMNIAQRGTSFNVVGNNTKYTVDRFALGITEGDFTATQDTDVPSGQGFASSIQIDNNSAIATLASGTQNFFEQKIEGQNLQHLKYGTSNAESITLSFWVKSNKTGTYIVWLYAPSGGNMISKSYTIDSANTWEKKTITYAGDTTAFFANNTAIGLYIRFMIGAGSNYQASPLATSWTTLTSATRYQGQVNLADSTSNYINITGVQLEVGTATPFEHRPYDMELQRCQRYLPVIGATDGSAYLALNAAATATTHGTATFEFPVQARTRPTGLELTASVGSYYLDDFSTGRACSAVSVLSSSNNGATIRGTTTGLTQYRPLYFWFSSGKILFTGCEL